MHPYINVLNQYLQENPLHTCSGNPSALIELLHCCYKQHSRMDTEKIRARYRQLDTILQGVPLEVNDAVSYLCADISEEYCSEAFREGVAAGMRIYYELAQQDRGALTSGTE